MRSSDTLYKQKKQIKSNLRKLLYSGKTSFDKIDTKFQSYTITNIYAPNVLKKRRKFFEKLETDISNNISSEEISIYSKMYRMAGQAEI